MITASKPHSGTKLILRGAHLYLGASAKTEIALKAERLFRHEPSILRLRVDLERDPHLRHPSFIAKGRIEIAGPDLTAAVAAGDPRFAINLLIDKLDRLLRKRASNLLRRRASGDIRRHVALGV